MGWGRFDRNQVYEVFHMLKGPSASQSGPLSTAKPISCGLSLFLSHTDSLALTQLVEKKKTAKHSLSVTLTDMLSSRSHCYTVGKWSYWQVNHTFTGSGYCSLAAPTINTHFIIIWTELKSLNTVTHRRTLRPVCTENKKVERRTGSKTYFKTFNKQQTALNQQNEELSRQHKPQRQRKDVQKFRSEICVGSAGPRRPAADVSDMFFLSLSLEAAGRHRQSRCNVWT